jgi:hypothetical protein
MLLLAGGRICYIKWRGKKDTILTDADPRTSDFQSQVSASQTGGWPQFQFALLSAVAGATGLGLCICTSFAVRYKFAAFCLYFASNCQIITVKSKFEDFMNSVLDSSNGESGILWVSAVNTAALNYVQLLLINRLFGTLAVADAGKALKKEHVWGWKLIERLPAILRVLIIVASATSIAAQSCEIAFSIIISQNIRRRVISTLNASAIINDSLAQVIQVCLLF